ncbi:hypothetical protein M0802_005886 [Mischocyttarus mexicanus]|nr:hypothetical protein M0802_005886 [Mischocyttarus mexicanus]
MMVVVCVVDAGNGGGGDGWWWLVVVMVVVGSRLVQMLKVHPMLAAGVGTVQGGMGESVLAMITKTFSGVPSI